jgi:glycosyltransferase involved in cell wall biosynthesis
VIGPPHRVLLVTQDLQRAGAQRQCVELALGMSRLPEWRVEVAVLEPGGPLTTELQGAGIPLHVCPRRWRWDLFPVMALAARLRAGGYAVVHSFLFLPGFYTRLAALRHRPPLVVSSHRSTGQRGRLRYLTEILMAPLCDVIIANSSAGREDLVARGVAATRVTVVRNGLDLSRFKPRIENGARHAAPAPETAAAATSAPRIGMVAQMESRKDHLGLIDAFHRVRMRHPAARLILGGDGSLRPKIEERVRADGLAGAVEFLGTVDAPETLYPTLDIYVQASAFGEGTSNSIIEAMASGLPVVATDVGGNREVVQQGDTGITVPPRDPAALAAALIELLDDPDRARRMGRAGARHALAVYPREAMVAATLEVYRSFLGRAGGGRR